MDEVLWSRLIFALGGDQRTKTATSAALQISGDVAFPFLDLRVDFRDDAVQELTEIYERSQDLWICLLYTSPSPRDGLLSRMPSSA